MSSAPLYVIDGSVYFFRGLFGVPDVFFDDRNRSVNGLKGYLHFLFDLLLTGDTQFVVVAFDESLNTCFRNDLYPAYKAHRPLADANVLHQLGLCQRFTTLLGVLGLAHARYEADDIIATVVARARRPVRVFSRDKDLLQLLRTNVTLGAAVAGICTEPEFAARFGFAPRLFPDFQALQGDAVDNIPGVRGVGAKTAGRLVAEFGGLEAIYANRRRWPEVGIAVHSRQSLSLRASWPQVKQFRELTRLRRRAPVSYAKGQLRVATAAFDPLRRALQQAGLARHFSGALAQLERAR